MKYIGVLILILAISYYWQSTQKINTPTKPQVQSAPMPFITHPNDWSVMVSVWMQTCHQLNLNLLKIDPKIGLDFNLYLQGQYQDFINWVQLVALKLPNVHWQKISIYHSNKQNLNFKLQGAYYENH